MEFIAKGIIVVGLAAVGAYQQSQGKDGSGWALVAFLILVFSDWS